MATTQKNAAKTNGKKASTKSAAKTKASKKAAQKSETTERHYGRDKETVATIIAEAKKEKSFPNPYRFGSSYWTVCQAVATLGLNKWHDADAVVSAYKKVADKDAYKAFKSREPRNENGLDSVDAKIIQNANVVLGRPNDYGLPLKAVSFIGKRQRTEDGVLQFGIFRK